MRVAYEKNAGTSFIHALIKGAAMHIVACCAYFQGVQFGQNLPTVNMRLLSSVALPKLKVCFTMDVNHF